MWAAASVVLLVIATLAVRAAVEATRIDVGFDASHLVVISGNPGGPDTAKAYLTVALDRVRSVPGVQAASLTEIPPFSGGTLGMDFTRGGASHRAFHTRSDAGDFATLGLRILRAERIPTRKSPRRRPWP